MYEPWRLDLIRLSQPRIRNSTYVIPCTSQRRTTRLAYSSNMGPDSQAQAQASSQPQPQPALPARSTNRPVPAFFSASHLGIGGGGASGSGNASASGSASGSGSGIGGSGGGWLGSGIGGSSKVERAEAKYDVTVDCEWLYTSLLLFKCRCWGRFARRKADIVRFCCSVAVNLC